MIGEMYLKMEYDRRHGVRERNERAISEVLQAALNPPNATQRLAW